MQCTLSLMGIEDIKWWDQTKAVSTVSMALMHFIFAQKYLDNRDNKPQIPLSSDKLGVFSFS